MTRLGILASGEGTNAEAIIGFAGGRGDFRVEAVLTDVPGAPVVGRCRRLGVPALEVPRAGRGRRAHEEAMLAALDGRGIRILCLAGFRRILGPGFLARFPAVVNVHPSLLPELPGLGAYGRAWRSGLRRSGVTIHLVDEGVDTGEVVAQAWFPREAGDTPEDFEARGRALERRLWPEALLALKGSHGAGEG